MLSSRFIIDFWALYNVMVTCEIKSFQPSLTSGRNNFITACGNLPEISKLFLKFTGMILK